MCGNQHRRGGTIRNSIYQREANGNDDDVWIHLGCYVDDLSINEVKQFGDTNIDFDWTTGSGFGRLRRGPSVILPSCSRLHVES